MVRHTSRDSVTIAERQPTILGPLRPLALALLGAVLLPGCGADGRVEGDRPVSSTQTTPDDEGFSLEIPGLGVDVKGKDGKWDVRAPGANVGVDSNAGNVDVDTPSTRVRRNSDTGVQVEAPGASVDVR